MSVVKALSHTGDWQIYLRARSDIKQATTPDANADEAVRLEMVRRRLQLMREAARRYLGPNRKPWSRSSRVFTPEVVAKLAAENLERRRRLDPYLVRLAELQQLMQASTEEAGDLRYVHAQL